MTSIDSRPTLAAPDDDPYVWLEDVDGAKAIAWADAESAHTMARFGDSAFATDRDTLAAILDRPDNIPYIGRAGQALSADPERDHAARRSRPSRARAQDDRQAEVDGLSGLVL